MTQTKNLGPARAIQYGLTPPSNIKMLWYDDNVGIKALKYYNNSVNDWVLLNYGISGDKNETITFTSVTSLTVNHTMNKYPSVSVVDTNGFIIECQIQYDMGNVNIFYVTFNTVQSGFIFLN